MQRPTRFKSVTDCMNVASMFDVEFVYGRMSQTGPKKCFIPQNCEKYTNFD